MKFNLLIKGGEVVDGTGAPARREDVRVSEGKIVEVGPDLAPRGRERIVDATGCYVTPGFIETHNHYDAPMWWMPNLEPMSGYGITTTVNGNCGFGAAPIGKDPEATLEMVKIFSFFEDIPIIPFREVLPWDWSKWSEYKASMQRNLRVPVNFEFYCGHQAMRLATMGMDARTRAATKDEIGEMCELLRDALEAGALGFSSNTMDYDGEGRPVPSLLADDAEYDALLDVLADFPGKTFQVILGAFQRYTAQEDIERMERIVGDRNIRMSWVGVPTLDFQLAKLPNLQSTHARFKEEGKDFYTVFHHVPPASFINFFSPLIFAQMNNLVWSELVADRDEDRKRANLEDPAWRARARESWDSMYPQSPMRHPQVVLMRESESGYGPIGLTLAEYIEQRGDNLHPSDATAEWVLDNGFGSTMSFTTSNASDELVIGLLKDPMAIGNVSDSGAHGQMLCGIGDHIDLIVQYAREKNALTVEEAVHNCTGKLSDFFGFTDRGVLEKGRNADITVWNINEIERRPTIKVFDVPDGTGGRTWRYTRAPAPVRLTLCNGVPTFDHGMFTGNYPGTIIGETKDIEMAEAAE